MRKLFLLLVCLFVAVTVNLQATAQQPAAIIKKATVAPVIDGVVDQVWATANVYNLERPLHSETPTLGTLGETTWRALWTADGVYVLISVTDDYFYPNYAVSPAGNDWDYDKPEIYFDVNNVLRDGLGAQHYNGHYSIAPPFTEGKNNGTPLTYWNGTLYAFMVNGSNYMAEYFIPRSTLLKADGTMLDMTQTIGFDIYINDRDPDDLWRRRMAWANSGMVNENWVSMDDMGLVTFEETLPAILVNSITLNQGGSITTDNGTLQMSATVAPLNAQNKNIHWTVSNLTGQATIDASGLLKAIKNGVVSVKATAADGGGAMATTEVTISGQVVEFSEVWNDLNLIKNWNTTSNLDWWGWVDGGAPGSTAPACMNGVVSMKVGLPADGAPWRYILYQTQLQAEPNVPYVFSFKSWATASTLAIVDFEDNSFKRYGASSDPQSVNGRSEWSYNLSTEPTWHTFHVTFDQLQATTDQKVQWMLAFSNETIFLDSILLVKEADYQGFTLSTSHVRLYPPFNRTTVNITGNVNWTVSSDQTWITATPASGTGNGQITLTASENPGEERTATIRVNSKGISRTITLVQGKNVVTGPHFTPIWSGNGYDHMNIHVCSATLNGLDLQAGDEIGIFDGEKCVGAGVLTGPIINSTTFDMVVSRDDGSGNGYIPGNAISYRIFDRSTSMEITQVSALYNNENPSWSTDGKFSSGASAFVELSGLAPIGQFIPLTPGWNIISSHVIPSSPELMSIFQSLTEDGSLLKVMNETGATYENFGTFGGWKNNIGNLNTAKGYKVNVITPSLLVLEGVPVTLPMTLSLNAGWNIISFPSPAPQDAMAILQSLMATGVLKKVMDESGRSIEDFGVFGGWINGIGNFVPGDGYKVNVSASCQLTIGASTTKSAVIVPEVIPSDHFKPVFTGNGTDHMNIHLVNLQASGLTAGDQIGIFDGEYCVGSATIGSEHMALGRISIAASANDETGASINGFTPGHPVHAHLFREGRTYRLNIGKAAGNEFFEMNGSLIAKVDTRSMADQLTGSEALDVRCYPNPFRHEMNIELQNPGAQEITIEIYNLAGQRIRSLLKGNAERQRIITWDGTNESGQLVSPGIYVCKVNGQSRQIIYEGTTK